MTLNIIVYLIGVFIKHRGKYNFSQIADYAGFISHDWLTRKFHLNWDAQVTLLYLIQRVYPFSKGSLIIDDTHSPKSYSVTNEVVSKQRSGKYKAQIMGMTVVMLLWTYGKWRIPVAIRIWKKGGPTKPQLALEMLSEIRNKWDWMPHEVLFDSAYATQAILCRLNDYGWTFVCQCPCSRTLNGVQLKRYKKQGYWTEVGKAWCGLRLKVIRVKGRFYLCNRLLMSRKEILDAYSVRWTIEETFRILKQECGWNDCQLHDEASYKRYLYFSLIVFLTLEACRIKEESDKTIYQIKRDVTLGRITFSSTRIKRVLRIA